MPKALLEMSRNVLRRAFSNIINKASGMLACSAVDCDRAPWLLCCDWV
jgi:hypothetical protein